ncbi:D-alanine--poly(phosphoribitol) ligase subunit DltC [Fodinisporobacter ferrooxydans]|uniref:D-alanyl carrier protein n=1 Tax=Fodinisporobacter ferrooxydans TaxID=2901836 RepID=A0ABY4CF43_9BACL|nr:D-alanine--poly(phosphoribitol) ligase subunit DltC [Alicyclobacillaceae bacterium MYW30-H2]
MSQIREHVLNILIDVCKEEEIRSHPDIHLFDSGLLDSMGIVELLVEIEEKLSVHISITEFDRDEWSTANKIMSYVESRA